MSEKSFPYPGYKHCHPIEIYHTQLKIEHKQCLDEGKAIEGYKQVFEAVQDMPDCPEKNELADILFKIAYNAPYKEDYKYVEPSDLEGIRQQSKKADVPVKALSKEELYDKVKGAWYGRICGCLLGKPFEGIWTGDMKLALEQTGNYPLSRYMLHSEITEEILKQITYKFTIMAFPDTIENAPVDDDTNYTVMASNIIERYGKDFTPENVIHTWVFSQLKDDYCTAERVAYLNYIKGYSTDFTAVYRNGFREWIGAQIRADYFGYINPFDIEGAAEMAWRDASISHVKNGIYGEMFVAAMLAAAYSKSDIKEVIRAGLSVLPQQCRLVERIEAVIDFYDKGNSYEDFFADFHKRYDEKNGHDWGHTISNAEIVAAALLFGGDDYGKSICLAVQSGLDTDCNGATVGSIMGIKNGFKAIPEYWYKPVNGKLDTTLFGMKKLEVESLVEKTIGHIEKYAKFGGSLEK